MSSKTFEQAIAKAHELPDEDQEQLGRELDNFIDQLQTLRCELDEGFQSLDAGAGRELDMEHLIARARVSLADGSAAA